MGYWDTDNKIMNKKYSITPLNNGYLYFVIRAKDYFEHDIFSCVDEFILKFYYLNNFYYYNLTLHQFLKEKRKIEARERIKELNEAKSDFMASLRVCSDVKRHIFSFL